MKSNKIKEMPQKKKKKEKKNQWLTNIHLMETKIKIILQLILLVSLYKNNNK